ncbi:MAG: hypothetical protein EBR01_07495 [Proteobacteria bacterium]|nr:hypothetical protein [Pseudomonadota bacterium]NBY20999.1 hypothetical protein [bacterium]
MKSALAFLLLIGPFAYSASETVSLSESLPSRFKVTASDHLIFSNAKNDVDQTSSAEQLFLNEGKIRAEFGDWSGDIHFTNRYQPNPNLNTRPSITLEKKTLQFESKDWQLVLGDSHQELGRGIAVSLFNEPAFGIDTTLEGAAVKYRPEGFEFNLWGGRVNAISNPVAINPVDMRMKDRNVLMASSSMAVKLSSDSRLGGHYLMTVNQRKSDLDLDDRFQTAGLTFSQDNIYESIDLYTEANMMLSDKASKGQWIRRPLARANYASISWTEAPWKFKAELKDYSHFDFDFRKPPSMEEEVPLANVPNNFSDITAGKLYAEYLVLGNGSKGYSSMLYGRDRLENADLYHAVTGGKISLSSKSEIEMKIGYRAVLERSEITHGSVKGKLKTLPGQMAELELRKQFSRLQLNTSPSKEDRNSVYLTYSFSESWNVTGGLEFIPTNDAEIGRQFFNLGTSYRRGALATRAFVGDTSGGAQCAGGVCRQAPAYSGAMFEASYLF